MQVDESNASKICKYIENPKNFLVYLGNPGIGKTYLCSALVAWAVKNMTSFRYWHEDQLFERLRSTISEGSGDYLKELHYMIDDQFVMIDDLAKNKSNEWREEVIFDLINTRYNSMLPTVFTSNLKPNEIYEKYHPRISSRLFAAENTIIQLHDGDDLRKIGM